MLIHLNGFPGVGKLTVAKELAGLTGARLIDNHALINLAYLATEQGTPEYLEFLTRITDALYDTLVNTPSIKNLILTNALAEGIEDDEMRFNKVAELARRRQELFVPVYLKCNVDENKARVIQPERASKQKLVNPEALENLQKKYKIYHPASVPNGLEIDVTKLSAQDTAQMIKAHCDRLS